jgi:predicted RNase H-like HicB family nuclease
LIIGGIELEKSFTLEYWIDDNWFIGRLKEVPGVFSQGENLQELEENIRDAYIMVLKNQDEYTPMAKINRKELSLSI